MEKTMITGLGIVSAAGFGLAKFSNMLFSGASAVRLTGNTYPVAAAALIDDHMLEEKPPFLAELPQELVNSAFKLMARTPKALRCAILCALEAWRHSACHNTRPDTLTLIIAGNNLTLATAYEMHEKYHRSPHYIPASYARHVFDTDYIGTLSQLFDIHDEAFTVGATSASGNMGVIHALKAIRHGDTAACMVVAPLTDLSPVEFQGLKALGAIGPKPAAARPERYAPFDINQTGFVYGQTSICLLLESLTSATRRNTIPLAEVLSGSTWLDGNCLTDPSDAGEATAMEKAIAAAGLIPADIDYINTHGTGSPLGDRTELAAIKKVFKDRYAEVAVNATKSITGHCLNSAGAVEIAACVLQLQEQRLHPNPYLDHPIDGTYRFIGKTAEKTEFETVLSNSFAFGGINTAVVLRKAGIS